MFDSTYKITYKQEQKGGYKLTLPRDSDWASKEQRVLVVLETVDAEDLVEGRLLHRRSRVVLENLLRFSISRAKAHGFKRSTCSFAAINFNNLKFMDKSRDTWGPYKLSFKDRLHSAVAEIKPTHILILGDHAASTILADYSIDFPAKKRGWVYDVKMAGRKVKVCTSLDLLPLYTAKKSADANEEDESDDEMDNDVYAKSNLLFYVSDHVTNLLCGKMLFDLSAIKPKPIYVDTIEKFDKLWKRLKAAEAVAVDTETRNGSVNHNAIHTIQFAFSPEKGYVLPYRHPDSPFTPKEQRYIGKRLRMFFIAPKGKYATKYIITQFGMFDLRIVRVEFGIPVIRLPVWEITAGEYCLDENRSHLAGSPFNTPHGGLEQIFMVYGNDHYKTASFGKGDRANPNKTRLDNKDFIAYGAMDVQSIFGIHLMQQERAKYLEVGDKSFSKYFRRIVLNQMSNTVHALSHMMQKGTPLDKAYLSLLKGRTSPLLKLLAEANKAVIETKEVQKANKLLLGENSGQKSNQGLFGKTMSVFNLGKQEHKEMLFFKVMGLKPVSYTKKAHAAQIDKNFVKAYEKEYPIVAAFGKTQKLKKLWSAYVKGWWNKIQESADSKVDWCLRASYGFFNVVTGRLNSYDPSLQQVPNRGAEAKYVKRAFIARVGRLLFKFDYSAHEIRVWSYVSGDEALAEAFKEGQALRKKLYLAKSTERVEKIMKLLKKRGDVHIQNVKFFFDQWVDKDHFLRDAIKQVVFGVVYSKSAKSLAKDLGKPVEFAQGLIDKMFSRFKKGAKWLQWTKAHAAEHGYTYSPLGMRRNLHGVLAGIQSITSSMLRKAANSPIQGLASQIGVTAARLIDLNAYDVFIKLGYMTEADTDLPADIIKAVHDALHSEVPYEMLLAYIHVAQWTATYGVTKYYKEVFGIEFPIEPEIEVEIGASEDNMHKWNWTENHLFEIIKQSLDEQKAIGILTEDPAKVYKTIMKAYTNSETKLFLDKHYPILGEHKMKENQA